MPPWAAAVLVLCGIAVSGALVAALLALRRVALRVDSVLGILEQDIHPLADETRSALEDVRALTRELNREIVRVGGVTERVGDVVDGVHRIVSSVAAVTRAGQWISVAVGMKKGFDVFVHRLRKEQGDHHG